jgi:hypothetical protein
VLRIWTQGPVFRLQIHRRPQDRMVHEITADRLVRL